MYSPKISEEIIPVLYKLRRHRGIPMTKLVQQLLFKALSVELLPEEIKDMLPGTSASLLN